MTGTSSRRYRDQISFAAEHLQVGPREVLRRCCGGHVRGVFAPRARRPWIDHVPHMTAEAEAIVAWQQSRAHAVQTDVIGGLQVPLQALLPAEVVRRVSEMLAKECGCAAAVLVLRGPCRVRILGFVGADEEGFWEVPGPERLMFLRSKRAPQQEVRHQATDLRREMAESDVLLG